LSRVKSLDDPRVRVISPVGKGKEKVYGGKDLLKSHDFFNDLDFTDLPKVSFLQH